MSAAQTEEAIRARDDDVVRCDAKRQFAVDAWPKSPAQRKRHILKADK